MPTEFQGPASVTFGDSPPVDVVVSFAPGPIECDDAGRLSFGDAISTLSALPCMRMAFFGPYHTKKARRTVGRNFQIKKRSARSRARRRARRWR